MQISKIQINNTQQITNADRLHRNSAVKGHPYQSTLKADSISFGSCDNGDCGNSILELFSTLLNAGTRRPSSSRSSSRDLPEMGTSFSDTYRYRTAVLNGNLERVQQEIARGVDVNAANVMGDTVLHYAITGEHPEIVKVLLAHPDTDVNRYDSTGLTPLMLAVICNNKNIIEEILKRSDLDTKLTDRIGQTAADYAKKFGFTEIAGMIDAYVPGGNNTQAEAASEAQKSAEPPYDTEEMERELASIDPAVKRAALKKLLDYVISDSFNPEFKDSFGRNVAHLSLLSRDEQVKGIISRAVGKGLDINAQNIVGQTVLMGAIKNFLTARSDEEKAVDLSNIKFILDQNPNIDIQDRNGQTAFHLACLSTSVALLTLILSKNPNVILKDVKGNRGSAYLKTDAVKEVYEKFIRG